MSGSGSNSGQRLQRSIQDLFSDEDDDMYEPATDQSTSGFEDETETDTFTGQRVPVSISVLLTP